ncbi:MAG: TSUP family transporter [Actinobacteria bacterium]|nr:TSUP family transporter [Actinomycetota bacterium]
MQFLGEVSLLTFSVLLLAAFCAGLIDAIAGGGGLIQLPALLIGLPNSETAQVLGTNKLAAVFGTSSAAIMYRRRTKPDLRFTLAMAVPAFIGSVCGALLAAYIPTDALRPLVFVLLVAVGIFTWRRPTLGHVELLRHSPRRRQKIAVFAGGGIGFYDGVFGPGTGTFLMLVLVAALGFAFLNASAIAKIVNVSTNIGAICVFGIHGVILWKLGLALGVANIVGGLIGARVAIRGGSAFVRRVFLIVTAILICKVGLDTLTHFLEQ